jgi:NTE family protein
MLVSPNRPRVGLALGSGMARGWAHIGVIRALHRLGIEADLVAGCSIGALVGGLYLAEQLDALEGWALSLTKLKIMRLLDFKMRRAGLIGGDRLVREMRRYLGVRLIETLPKPYSAVATDLTNGHEVWLQRGDLAAAMRASFSLPGVFPPMQVGERWLLDGALVNPLPVTACRAMGAEIVIAVNLNADSLTKVLPPVPTVPEPQPFELLKTLRRGMSSEARSGVIDDLEMLTRRLFRQDAATPSLVTVMTASLNIMQDRITRARLAGDPPDVHLAPRLGHIGLLDFDRAAEAIRAGEDAVERKQADLAGQVLLCPSPCTQGIIWMQGA